MSDRTAAQCQSSKRWRQNYERKNGVKYSTLVYRMTRKVNYPPRECSVCGKMFKPKCKRSNACSMYCKRVNWRLKAKGLE